MRKKHAYLIIAHNEFSSLTRLLAGLDDPRNSIYLHIDKKCANVPEFKVTQADFYVLRNRIDGRWGDSSLIDIELLLFREAYQRNKNHLYYHLLSGVDLPIKTQDYIHNFFARHQGQEFINFSRSDYQLEAERRVQRYHLFPKHFRAPGSPVNWLRRGLRAGFIRVQELLGIYRNKNITFKGGTQWVSVTGDFVGYLLSHEAEIKKNYWATFCADEIYKQTLCWNSPFRRKAYQLEASVNSSLRMINWQNNEILDWTVADVDTLLASKNIFARKFTSSNQAAAEKIVKKLFTNPDQ